MIFNSPIILLFLIAVITLNYFVSPLFRSFFLLAASFAFIGYYSIESLLAVIIFAGFNFYIAKKISGNRLLYITGLLLNSYAIIMFNYFHITKHGVDFSYSFVSFNIGSFVVALGLSFYSLQNIAYLSEIYFKRFKPVKNIVEFGLYNSFFPKVISGPVMLPAEFMPQISKNTVTKEKLISGFNRFLVGVFKKIVIADRLSPAVHSIFDFGDQYSGITTIAGIYLFTIQLYFDFSGYTDMALGIGKMLGYDLKENFNFPLRSTSVSEFWRRWHISLIGWFTNYIYYPLVYRLRSYKKAAALTGIVVTFLVSGIWHGIGLTFLAWAFCHIVYLSFELMSKRFRVSLSGKVNHEIYEAISIFIVFNAVCFSNIFFRSASVEAAFQLIENSVSHFFPVNWLSGFIAPLAVGGHQVDEFNFYISLLICGSCLLFERRINKLALSTKLNVWFITIVTLLIFLFGIFNNGERFIYMQF